MDASAETERVLDAPYEAFYAGDPEGMAALMSRTGWRRSVCRITVLHENNDTRHVRRHLPRYRPGAEEI